MFGIKYDGDNIRVGAQPLVGQINWELVVIKIDALRIARSGRAARAHAG